MSGVTAEASCIVHRMHVQENHLDFVLHRSEIIGYHKSFQMEASSIELTEISKEREPCNEQWYHDGRD